MTLGDSPTGEIPSSNSDAPSVGRGAATMIAGRGVTLALSILGLFLFPALLGPEAHGWLQYYLSLELLLLAFPNGCAAPIAAHYVAVYRVSNPGRLRILFIQSIRWFLILWLLTSLFHFLLPDRRGLGWIHLSVGFSACSQLLASGLYGAGSLSGVAWFPVLNLFIRLILVSGGAVFLAGPPSEGGMEAWGLFSIPILLLVSTLPSWFWMSAAAWGMYSRMPKANSGIQSEQPPLFPWEEIRRFGLAALIGQILFQSFTRALPVAAAQLGFPAAQVGYLGVATQAFGQILFIAGFISVALYPWLVSAAEAGDSDRFRRLQSVAWRLCAFLGGGLAAGAFALIDPAIRVFLPEYRPDAEVFTLLVRIGVISGFVILAGEFHLRMLVSLTRMRQYLLALAAGFVGALVHVIGVAWNGGGILPFTLALPVGGTLMTAVALFHAPRAEGFWRSNLKAAAIGILAFVVSRPFSGESVLSILLEGAALCVVYVAGSWAVGLVGAEDLARVRSGLSPGRPRIVAPD